MKDCILKIIVYIILGAGMFCLGASVEKNVKLHKIECVEDKLDAWEMLELSIMKTESEFNTSAVGKTHDIGLMQITPIYVAEVNRLLDTMKFSHADAFNAVSTLEMFNIIQNAKNSEKDFVKAINIHNPGGAAIDYYNKVLKNYNAICKYEEIREIVINYHNSKNNN